MKKLLNIILNRLSSLKKILPSYSDSSETRYFKILLYSAIGIIVLTVFVGTIVFMLTLQGAETTMVPDVRDKEIQVALIELQERGLFPQIQLRYSSNPNDKGMILAQRPVGGTLVKAGKRITLVVSKGTIITAVDNFIGKSLDEAKLQIQEIASYGASLIKLSEPIQYVYDDSPINTIIAQQPKPGSPITGTVNLHLVVSRGAEDKPVKIPDMIGKTYSETLTALAAESIPFVFRIAEKTAADKPGTVVSQLPEADSEQVAGTPMQVSIVPPASIPKTSVFGIFEMDLPTYPIPVDLTVELLTPDGVKTTLFTMRHHGGSCAFPYLVPDGTEVIVSIYDREEIRRRVYKE